jgi:hypothetical protein
LAPGTYTVSFGNVRTSPLLRPKWSRYSPTKQLLSQGPLRSVGSYEELRVPRFPARSR